MESLGRYRLIKLLATGGMGEVFLARQEGPAGFTKTVVIKRILRHLAGDQNFIDLFLNEARLAAQLQHPHIAQVFGLENEGNTWFIAMEYVHGRSLRDVLRAAREQRLLVPPRIAARLAAQALQGLDFAHELTDERGQSLGILHRDVSPENLLVSFSGSVKLVDFGIAKAMTGAATRVGRPKGKLAYMAPELTVAGAVVDRRADIYAMGVVLAEALTLEQPSNTPHSVEAAQQRSPWQPVPGLPKGLNDILERALALDPRERFSTASAMGDALEGWLVSSAQAVVPGDVVGFLSALFGPGALDVNAGVVADDLVGSTGVLSNRRGGTQPLSVPSLQAVQRTFDRPPAEAPPTRGLGVVSSVLVGSATALLIGFVLVLALWPRERRALEATDAGPVATPSLVLPSEVEFEADVPEEAPDAGPSQAPRAVLRKTVKTGRVSVRVNPWAEVLLGGKNLGTTPLAPVEVPAGVATFVLRNSQLGVTRKVTVKVPPGGSVVLKADLFTR